MTLWRKATHMKRADLFRAGPFVDTSVREMSARIRQRGY